MTAPATTPLEGPEEAAAGGGVGERVRDRVPVTELAWRVLDDVDVAVGVADAVGDAVGDDDGEEDDVGEADGDADGDTAGCSDADDDGDGVDVADGVRERESGHRHKPTVSSTSAPGNTVSLNSWFEFSLSR